MFSSCSYIAESVKSFESVKGPAERDEMFYKMRVAENEIERNRFVAFSADSDFERRASISG
jgi:hypothetical protein